MKADQNEAVKRKKKEVTVRKVLRILAVLCVVFVFCPSFMVSCAGQSLGITAMSIAAVSAVDIVIWLTFRSSVRLTAEKLFLRVQDNGMVRHEHSGACFHCDTFCTGYYEKAMPEPGLEQTRSGWAGPGKNGPAGLYCRTERIPCLLLQRQGVAC